MPLPASAPALAVLCVIAMGGPATAWMLAAMQVITDTAERIGIALAFTTMIFILGWATGEMVGAPVAAGLAAATTDAVPLALVALLMVISLVAVRGARLPCGATAERPAQPTDASERVATESVPAASA
jgi:hypothetical protein